MKEAKINKSNVFQDIKRKIIPNITRKTQAILLLHILVKKLITCDPIFDVLFP